MDLITELEFARLLGVKRETVQGFRRRGLLPFIPGVPTLFDRTDVDIFIAKRKLVKEIRRAEKLRKPTPEERAKAWEIRTRFRMMVQAEEAQKRRDEQALLQGTCSSED